MSSTSVPSAPASKDSYTLARDFKSASRLNYEHFLWHENLGFNIHPTVSEVLFAKTDTFLRIADVACGTGMFLTQVAASMAKSNVLCGYDISLAQAPCRAFLPANVELSEWDLYSSDLPAEVESQGKFDFVHVRLLYVVIEESAKEYLKHLSNHDPQPTEGECALEVVSRTIRSISRLVKPGGWLQWDELDVGSSYTLRVEDDRLIREDDSLRANPDAESQSASLSEPPAPIVNRTVQYLRSQGKWVRMISEIMAADGLESTQLYEYDVKTELARAFYDNHMAKDEEMVASIRERDPEKSRQLKERTKALNVESKRSEVVICTPKVVCVARKPLRR